MIALLIAVTFAFGFAFAAMPAVIHAPDATLGLRVWFVLRDVGGG